MPANTTNAHAAEIDPTTDTFAEQVHATRSGEEFTVLMKNYIATHFGHQLGSKVLLLNTKDGLETLAALVRKKLADRADRADSTAALPALNRSATILTLPAATLTSLRRVA